MKYGRPVAIEYADDDRLHFGLTRLLDCAPANVVQASTIEMNAMTGMKQFHLENQNWNKDLLLGTYIPIRVPDTHVETPHEGSLC